MIGAMQAKGAVDEAEEYLTHLIESNQTIVDTESGQQAIDDVKEQFPIIGNYIDSADFSGLTISELPEAVHKTMTNSLSSFIWHRVYWILGSGTLACIVVILFQRGETRSDASFGEAYSGGGNLQF